LKVDPEVQKLIDSEKEIYDYGNRLKMINFYEDDLDLFVVTLDESQKHHGIGRCVHIASFITSMARIRLNEGIYTFTENGRKPNVFYCDTDSIFGRFDNMEKPKDMFGDDLGQWKEEDKFTEGLFLAPKTYTYLSSKTHDLDHPKIELRGTPIRVLKCKGIRKKKLKLQAFEDIYKYGITKINIGGVFKRIIGGVRMDETIKIISENPRRLWLKDNTSLPPIMIRVWPLDMNDPRILTPLKPELHEKINFEFEMDQQDKQNLKEVNSEDILLEDNYDDM
jgi:hypothetical protein